MPLIVHSGKAIRYYAAQYLTVTLLSILFSLFAVLYPIVFGMFDKPITLSQFVLGYLGHAACPCSAFQFRYFFSLALWRIREERQVCC